MKALAELFIQHQIESRRAANKHRQPRFLQECEAVRKLAANMPDNATEQHLADYWHTFKPSAQRNNRYIFASFVSWLIIGKHTTITANVFNPHSDAWAGYQVKPEKQRMRLTLEQYKAIEKQARPFLVNAMRLSIATGFRRGDILSITFDHIQNGILRKTLNKSEAQLGSVRAVHKQITLAKHKPILAIVNACRVTRHATRDGKPAVHLIHDPELLDNGKADKAHYSSITPEYLSRAFQQARDATGLFDDVAPAERPTFHEIRSLHVHIRLSAGEALEAIQGDLGHHTIEMTEHYAAGHEIDWQEIGIIGENELEELGMSARMML